MTSTRQRWIQARDQGDDERQKELYTGEAKRCLLVSVSGDDEWQKVMYAGEAQR